jgi:hypothetical protein
LGLAAAAPDRAPTKGGIEAQTRAAVRASGARLVALKVVTPNRTYRLIVKPAHPAPYLKRRVNRLVRVMNRLTIVERRFTRRYFAVLGPSGTPVLWVDRLRIANGESITWNVRSYLADCIRNVDLEIEVDPDHTAPPCPAQ